MAWSLFSEWHIAEISWKAYVRLILGMCVLHYFAQNQSYFFSKSSTPQELQNHEEISLNKCCSHCFLRDTLLNPIIDTWWVVSCIYDFHYFTQKRNHFLYTGGAHEALENYNIYIFTSKLLLTVFFQRHTMVIYI